jgi:hypothetical protein
MKATKAPRDLGQSLWLDNITRDILDKGTLRRYIDELSVTGLTSNPTIFDHAIRNSTHYDAPTKTSLYFPWSAPRALRLCSARSSNFRAFYGMSGRAALASVDHGHNV